jgi:hypothetical protein
MKLVILDEKKEVFVHHDPEVFKKLLIKYSKKQSVEKAFEQVVKDLKEKTKYK